jgi:thiol-disulfide isomerase/thioredoxin
MQLSPVAEAQTTAAPTASSSAQDKEKSPDKEKTSAGPQQASSQDASKPLKAAALPVVEELDGEALKKLLQRDRSAAGAGPLLVNFWATWCEPCREEFPDLVRLDTEFRPRGLEFITVSLDDVADIKTSVPQYLHTMRASMPAYLLNVPDPNEIILSVDPAWSGAMPATFLYDARGRLVYKHLGRIKTEELRAVIEKALKPRG